MSNKLLIVGGLICSILSACTIDSNDKTKVILYTVSNTRNVHFRVKSLPLQDNEVPITIDSAFSENIQDTLIFTVPHNGECLYEISMSNSRMRITFVNDSPEIIIKVNYFDEKYSLEGSAASASLKRFEDNQFLITQEIIRLNKSMRNLARLNSNPSRIDALSDSIYQKHKLLNIRSISFADTVQSPTAFIKIYDSIDFGSDYTALKNFITRASLRFPDYSPIQNLKIDVLKYVRIFEEEYEIGELLPPLTLPDRHGRLFRLDSFKKKVILINFWATWCPQCISYMEANKRAKKIFPQDKFEIISIAIDNEKDAWIDKIEKEKYDWLQLIDEEMWRGKAVNTFKFDSIPFNFLIAEDGRIFDKAIEPDSLAKAINHALKK